MKTMLHRQELRKDFNRNIVFIGQLQKDKCVAQTQEIYKMLYMVICFTKINICDNLIGNMAFCLSPILTE